MRSITCDGTALFVMVLVPFAVTSFGVGVTAFAAVAGFFVTDFAGLVAVAAVVMVAVLLMKLPGEPGAVQHCPSRGGFNRAAAVHFCRGFFSHADAAIPAWRRFARLALNCHAVQNDEAGPVLVTSRTR